MEANDVGSTLNTNYTATYAGLLAEVVHDTYSHYSFLRFNRYVIYRYVALTILTTANLLILTAQILLPCLRALVLLPKVNGVGYKGVRKVVSKSSFGDWALLMQVLEVSGFILLSPMYSLALLIPFT